MPKRIEVSAHTSAPPSVVFARLADAQTWPRWSPIERAVVESPGREGVLGEVRRFETGRVTSREEVVEVAPDRRLSYILLSGLPLADYRADIDLKPEAGGTLITWRSSFRATQPGSGWLYKLFLKRFLRRMVEGLARATSET